MVFTAILKDVYCLNVKRNILKWQAYNLSLSVRSLVSSQIRA